MKLTHQSRNAIQEALTFVAASDIPVPHKAVLTEVVTRALRSVELEDRFGSRGRQGKPWQSDELRAIAARLEGKTAISWQHADELLTALCALLRRTPAETKSKAVELGFALGVDYASARANVTARPG